MAEEVAKECEGKTGKSENSKEWAKRMKRKVKWFSISGGSENATESLEFEQWIHSTMIGCGRNADVLPFASVSRMAWNYWYSQCENSINLFAIWPATRTHTHKRTRTHRTYRKNAARATNSCDKNRMNCHSHWAAIVHAAGVLIHFASIFNSFDRINYDKRVWFKFSFVPIAFQPINEHERIVSFSSRFWGSAFFLLLLLIRRERVPGFRYGWLVRPFPSHSPFAVRRILGKRRREPLANESACVWHTYAPIRPRKTQKPDTQRHQIYYSSRASAIMAEYKFQWQQKGNRNAFGMKNMRNHVFVPLRQCGMRMEGRGKGHRG